MKSKHALYVFTERWVLHIFSHLWPYSHVEIKNYMIFIWYNTEIVYKKGNTWVVIEA